MGRASGTVPLPGCSPTPGTRCTQPAPASRFPPWAGSAFLGCRTTPRGAVTKQVPFGGRSSRSPPQKPSTNSCCPQGQSPEAMGMSHGAVGMSHASTGRAPSLPTIHWYPQERRKKQGSRAEIHRNTSIPITPPAHREQQGARRTFLPWVHVLFGGDTPSMASPAPFPCSGCLCPRRAVLLRLHGHPTLSPGNVPPAPMIHHFVARTHTGLFPFPTALPKTGKRGNLVTAKAVAAGGPGTHVP